MSVRSSWFSVLFKASVSLLIFCLAVSSIIVSGVLKSPTIIVELSMSPFNAINCCFVYFDGLSLDV